MKIFFWSWTNTGKNIIHYKGSVEIWSRSKLCELKYQVFKYFMCFTIMNMTFFLNIETKNQSSVKKLDI